MAGMMERGKSMLKAIGAVSRLTGGATVTGSNVAVPDPGSMVGAVPVGRSGFMRGGNGSPFLFGWRPQVRDAAEEVRMAWGAATARAEDLIRNSGWIAGGIRSSCGQVIGDGLRLSPQPDTTLVKFDGLVDDAGAPIDADGWVRFVKRRWQSYANDPAEVDARGIQTFAQMTVAAFRTWYATGEIVALLPQREDDYSMTRTKVQLIPPHRLSQKTDPMNRIFQGVRHDERGRPVAYVFQMRKPDGQEGEIAIFARDGAGRPQVIHVFEGLPTQVRGITPLVPVLDVVKKYDQLAGATLTSALLQTIFSATVESDLPTQDVLAGMAGDNSQGTIGDMADFVEARMGWNLMNGLDLGGDSQARVAHLFPGEHLEFNRSEHPNSNYETFSKLMLRETAKGCGVTFSQMTGDYTGVTYTGVRMEGTDNWQITLDRRNNIAARFCQPVYEAWLEEEIEFGRIKFPGGLEGFLRIRGAACRARWLGPPKPAADDVKQSKVHQTYRELGLMSDEMIANDLGYEIDDIYAQRKREADLRKKYELDDVGPSTQQRVAEISAEANEGDEGNTTEPGALAA